MYIGILHVFVIFFLIVLFVVIFWIASYIDRRRGAAALQFENSSLTSVISF